MTDEKKELERSYMDMPAGEMLRMIALLVDLLLIRLVFWPIRRLAYCYGYLKAMADAWRENFWGR